MSKNIKKPVDTMFTFTNEKMNAKYVKFPKYHSQDIVKCVAFAFQDLIIIVYG